VALLIRTPRSGLVSARGCTRPARWWISHPLWTGAV